MAKQAQDLSPDPELAAIADYVLDYEVRSDAAFATGFQENVML